MLTNLGEIRYESSLCGIRLLLRFEIMFNCAYLQSTRVIRVIFELVQVFVGFGVIRNTSAWIPDKIPFIYGNNFQFL